MDSSSNLKV